MPDLSRARDRMVDVQITRRGVRDPYERARFVQRTSVSWTKSEHETGSAGFDAILKPNLPGVIPQRCLQSDIRKNVTPDGTDYQLRNGRCG